jgi:hypothetical protein
MVRFQKLTRNLFLTLHGHNVHRQSVLPPHFHRNVRVLLSGVLQQHWIGRAAKGDKRLLHWPPRSLDLTQCNFFLWGFVNPLIPN